MKLYTISFNPLPVSSLCRNFPIILCHFCKHIGRAYFIHISMTYPLEASLSLLLMKFPRDSCTSAPLALSVGSKAGGPHYELQIVVSQIFACNAPDRPLWVSPSKVILFVAPQLRTPCFYFQLMPTVRLGAPFSFATRLGQVASQLTLIDICCCLHLPKQFLPFYSVFCWYSIMILFRILGGRVLLPGVN